ncbi:MAG: condensation domain-containing protein, partial [Acidobacteriota bacterium]
QLRAWLSRSLPAYMIPAAFVTLEELPLNANGKLDRGALPDPVDVADDLGSAPRTPMEELVVGIWIDLLGRQAIGLDENFFDLGGHSLLAMQVRARLREACEVELSLPTLFEAPTVAGLAKALERGRRGAHEEEPSIERVPRDRDLPTSFAQERLWVLHQMEPDSPAYHIFVAVELRGRLDISALASSFSEICRRHESLRTAFATLQGQAVQQITPPRPWIGSLVELTGLGSKTVDALVRRLAIDESRRPFDLSRGELMRCLLLRRGASEHVILLTLHHIVSDGWSMAILLREMMVLYEAFSRGLPSPLHALPIQYADFAVWQRQWLDDARMKQEMDYWRGQLAGVPELLELPTDRPRPQVQSDRGGLVTSSLPGELAADLQALCRREGVTLFMALTAGFNALLYALTGREDLVVGTDVAGRERAELEGLIGFFVNQLVLRTDLSGEPTLREVLHRVRRVALDAYAHQNLPFEKLVAAVNPRRSLSYAPLFQVKLILQHASASEPPQGSELTMRRLRLRAATSQIDLLINVTAAAEGLWLSAEYSADLFEAATVERWLARFATVLSWLATRSEATLAELRQQLMQEDRQDKQTTENALAAASQDKLRKLKRRPRMLSAG